MELPSYRSQVETDEQFFSRIFDGSRLPGVKTKINIIEAFIRCISMHGLPNLSYEKIANQCDLPKNQVFYHFKSYGEMLEAASYLIGQRAYRLTRASMNPDDYFLDQIISWGEANVEWFYRSPQSVVVLVLTTYHQGINDRARELVEGFLDPAQSLIYEILRNGLPPNTEDASIRRLISILQTQLIGIGFANPAMSFETAELQKSYMRSMIKNEISSLIVTSNDYEAKNIVQDAL